MALMFSIPDPEPMDGILSLKGQCAVVTGGSRGLGEAIVKRFVEAGATVVLTGRGLEALQRVEAQVAEAGGTALGVQADVSRIEDSEKVINKALERFGKIDILVNNAAVYQGCMSLEMTEAFWDETVDTDLKGAFFAAQFAAKAMVEAGSGGRIINLLSVDAFKISGFLPAYTAAKAGLWAITQSLAKELAQYRILVNAVCPGAILTTERIAAMSTGKMVDQQIAPFAVKTREMMMGKFKAALESGGLANRMTNMMPLGRPGYPDDIAKAVLFMASGLANYISGVCLTVDGGQTLRDAS